jgi:AcrR family transcriptional regulator
MSSTATDAGRAARRRPGAKQADTVARLAAAAVEELRAAGYEGLTVRNVARRAGVAPATAYTWFGSKDHLVAEAFWRRLQAVGEPRVDRRRAASTRVAAAMEAIGRLVADEPALAAASTTAVLAPEPDVMAVRRRIGAFVHGRLAAALGDDAGADVLDTLDLVFSGAMLQAGVGVFGYDELAPRMAAAARLVLEGPRR